jgi:hypothetical protein
MNARHDAGRRVGTVARLVRASDRLPAAQDIVQQFALAVGPAGDLSRNCRSSFRKFSSTWRKSASNSRAVAENCW